LTAAFKRQLVAPDYISMYETAIDLLNERLATYLSMAQKAGFVISGYMPLHKAIAQGKIVCLILAADIADTRKQEYQTWCAQRHIPALTCFTKTRLGIIIGKSSRSAVGLTETRFYRLLSATKASLDTLQSCDPSTQTKS
jgi:ribosomal protein L7Ae-like RNA K-turn-binding protein